MLVRQALLPSELLLQLCFPFLNKLYKMFKVPIEQNKVYYKNNIVWKVIFFIQSKYILVLLKSYQQNCLANFEAVHRRC